jgi:5-methylcytosine-specific restriction endonuclease McrA
MTTRAELILRCTQCGESRSETEFHRHASSRTGRRSYCKDCSRAYLKAWVEANPEKRKAQRQREYAAHADAVKKRAAEWYRENGEQARERRRRYYRSNREHELELMRQWQEHNRDRAAALKSAARLARRAAVGRASADAIAARVAMWGGMCWLCGVEATEIDHVKPIAAGGSGWPANLRPICSPCNRSKGARWGGVVALGYAC